MTEFTIRATLENILEVMDARRTVNIFRRVDDKHDELIASGKALLLQTNYANNKKIMRARVVGLSVTLGDTSILIEEA